MTSRLFNSSNSKKTGDAGLQDGLQWPLFPGWSIMWQVHPYSLSHRLLHSCLIDSYCRTMRLIKSSHHFSVVTILMSLQWYFIGFLICVSIMAYHVRHFSRAYLQFFYVLISQVPVYIFGPASEWVIWFHRQWTVSTCLDMDFFFFV